MRGILVKADQLALLGAFLEHEDLLDYIIEGLSDDYKAIIDMVNGRDIPITLEELHEKLLIGENSLATTEETTNSSAQITANATQSRPFQQNQRPQYRGTTPTRGGHQGRGRGYLCKCQICGVQGHSARRCPHYSSASTMQYRPGAPQMQTSQWHAPPPMPPPQWNPQAHYTAASPSDMSMLPWLGASHHIASDLSNMSLHTPYEGGDNVMIGNGTGLPITHTGSTKLPSSSRSLVLNNVLCVPSMKKNLISVNKLCKTNNVMVQMCPFDFQVKDLRTGKHCSTDRPVKESMNGRLNHLLLSIMF